MSKTLAVATMCIVSLLVSSANAGFTNNTESSTFVAKIGSGSGDFRVNSLTSDGQMKTSRNSDIVVADADSYSTEFSGSFDAYWVATANFVWGIDFDVIFDDPIVGIVATNGLPYPGGPLSVDLMREFTAQTSVPSFLGPHIAGLEILPSGEFDTLQDMGGDNTDMLTVDGNRVFGQVNSVLENFVVLTAPSGSGGSVVATPEPATMTVWALLGLVSSGAGYVRLRRKAA